MNLDMSGSSDTTKAPVPKFTSFRPRATASAAIIDQATKFHPKSIEDRVQAEEGRKAHESRSHHHHHHRRNKDDGRVLEANESKADEKQVTSRTVRAVKEDTPEVYVVDRKGDVSNLTYGTLHRYSIPSYFRTGEGRVVGLPVHCKIDRDASDQQVLYITSAVGQNDGGKSKFYSKRYKEAPSRILRVRPTPDYDYSVDSKKDFIALSNHESRKQRRVDGEDQSSSDEESRSYRSIEGKANSANTIDEDLDLQSEESQPEEDTFRDISAPNRQKSINLSRATESRPTDVNAWIALINHQGLHLQNGGSSVQGSLTHAEKRSIADLKISIYEKAIEMVNDVKAKERLILGMMKEGAVVWETKRLSSKWQSVLQEYPGFITLWIQYLDFQQTDFLGFTYERCRSIYLDCLRILKLGHACGIEIYKIQIYVLLRMTLFMREAGFGEHATAIWQALLELNFFPPNPSTILSPSLKASFEDFWESEVARIGEDGSRGWKNATTDPVNATTDVSTRSLNDLDLFGSWVECETEAMLRSRRAARTLDDVEEDDPYRVILFSDVQDYIAAFNDTLVKDFLIQSFLAFCHLPPSQTWNRLNGHETLWTSAFVRNELLSRTQDLPMDWFAERLPNVQAITDFANDKISDTINKLDDSPSSPLFYPIRAFPSSVDTLFADHGRWFSSFIAWNELYPGNAGPVEFDWARRILKALVDANESDDGLAVYYLAFQWVNDPNGAKKTAKALLKKRPSSLQLYNAYAIIEQRSGNMAAADKVWSTAISMDSSSHVDQSDDRILLWRTWAWEALTENSRSKVLRILLAIPVGHIGAETSERFVTTDDRSNPADLLRSRKFLTMSQEQALSLGLWRKAVYFTECLALLTYVTQGSATEPALRVFRSAIDSMIQSGKGSKIYLEELHQSRARLLYYHMTTVKYYKSSIIREELEESVSAFPNNTIFLSLYDWHGARFRIDHRIRSIVQIPRSASLTEDSVVTHFFSIASELRRSVSSGSTLHSSRAAFERAVDHPSGKSSAAIWKLYLLFELKNGESVRVKNVFYRGMRACPWAKSFIMLAFTHLKGIMTFEELRKVYNVIGEKELRIHVDLEVALEQHDERTKQRGTDEKNKRLAIQLPDDASSDGE